MEGRGLTNLLLAVIAGALLFGKDAMVGGLQGIAVVLVAILIFYLCLIGVGALLASIAQSYRDAKNTKERLLVTFGLLAFAVLVPLGAYVGWLWLSGVKQPWETANNSWLGKAWTGILVAGVGGWVLYGVRIALIWIRGNWRYWPDFLILGVRYLGTAVIAPFVFPVREWRFKREKGFGVVLSFFSSMYAGLFGLALWMLLLVIASFAMIGLGIVD